MDGCRALYACVLASMVALAGAPERAVADADRAGWGDPCRPADAGHSAAIEAMYDRRDRAPVWVTKQGTTPSGRHLMRLLETAGEGIVTECLEAALANRGGRYSRGQLDVMLTDAYLALAERRSGDGAGLQESLAALDRGAHERRQRQLDRLAERDEPDPLPDAGASERMAAALERYRHIAREGGWPRVGEGVSLEPGTGDPRVPALRERLAATGDLPAGARYSTGSAYEGALVEAVMRFQQRHGLAPDGVVGGATRAALDVSARERVVQLETNLRRIERHEVDGPDPVVRVNIPGFRVTVLQRGREIFSSRAIVGRPDRPTPRLRTRITALTLNPAWNVPQKILQEDLADVFARDAGFAERHGFRAVDGGTELAGLDWSERPTVAVRQDPGPTNALGRIKFEMPNGRAIYLHDTPERSLFHSRTRAFSAGCVRVEDPMQLAATLSGIDPERLDAMAATGETRSIRFGWQIPVQLVYFTAWVDPGGRVQFRPDIYNLHSGRLRARASPE